MARVGVLKAALLCTAVDVFPEAEVPGKGLMGVLSHSGNTQELSQWCKRSRTGRELIKLIYHYIIRQHFALSTSGSVRASREKLPLGKCCQSCSHPALQPLLLG